MVIILNKVEEKLKDLKKEYENMQVPVEGMEIMIKAMNRAKADKRMAKPKKRWNSAGLGAAAAIIILIILPNTNERIAYAMERIPLIGKIFEVITIRDYTYDDGHNSAEVKVPKVIPEEDELKEHPAVNQVNKSVDEYTKELLVQFENNMQIEGYQNLDISYEVVTNNDTWFALDIAAVQTEASGYEFHKFYNINKATGENLELKDLFKEGSGYVSIISEEIKKQMRSKMSEDEGLIYWLDNQDYPEDNFKEIKTDQNFYLDDEENLVVIFDEYEVAPGYMGVQKFTIDKEMLRDVLK